MSQSKPKDKKNEFNLIDIGLYEAQKKELLSATFTVKKLEQRLSTITRENMRVIQQSRENKKIYEQKIQQLSIKNETNEKRLLALSGEKTKLEIDNSQKQSKIKLFEKQAVDEQQLRVKQLDEFKKSVNFEISKYESQLMEYRQYMNERDELENERANLREQIEMEKAHKIRQVADKEREKVQATDKLRDEMLKKIRQMRTNLLSLKKEQLSTTTRLTVLQNHQLTSQLQYQSKQTEKLIFKNEEMQAKISILERDLQIHKQVQEQLAKRSHLSKGMIKKLNLRVSELEQQVDELRKKQLTKAPNLSVQNQYLETLTKNDITIRTLNHMVESSQKKHSQLSTRYELLLKQKEEMFHRLNRFENSGNKMGTMLLRYFYQILNGTLEEVDETVAINFSHLKDKEVDEWKRQDVNSVTRILLTVMKPMLTRTNLTIPYIRKNVCVLEENQKSFSTQQLTLPEKRSYKKLPQMAMSEDRYMRQIKSRIQDLPVKVASKVVSSNLRQWGKTINLSTNKLRRKYKLSESYRG